jgi:hypothetical protein
MAAFNSKVQICNLAAGAQGLKNSINNIDTPTSDKEIVFAQWYDITRQHVLKFLMPNFALARVILAPLPTVPAAYASDYQFAFQAPSNCLKVLGLGPADTQETKPTYEGGVIYTNVSYGNNAPVLRYIADITDVTQMTPDFVMTFASILGKLTAMVNTQDPSKKASLLKDAMQEWTNSTAQNAQENKPIRVTRSRFRDARRTNNPDCGRNKR